MNLQGKEGHGESFVWIEKGHNFLEVKTIH